MRLRADRPSAQRFRGPTRTHAAETRLGAFLRPRMHLAARIGKIEDVMHHGARRRMHVDSRDPFVFGKAQRDGDVAVNIGPIRRHMISRGHLDNQIGLAQLPSGSEPGRLRLSGGVAFRHALLHPLLNQRDIAVIEPAVVAIRVRSRLRFPRRHQARGSSRGNNASLVPDVLIRKQSERRSLPRTMAGRAMVVNDRCDLLIESDRLSRRQRDYKYQCEKVAHKMWDRRDPGQRRTDYLIQDNLLWSSMHQVKSVHSSENEGQPAPKTTRSIDQQKLLAIRQRNRQISLRQQIAQLGRSFHAPRHTRNLRYGLPQHNVKTRLRARRLGRKQRTGQRRPVIGPFVAGDKPRPCSLYHPGAAQSKRGTVAILKSAPQVISRFDSGGRHSVPSPKLPVRHANLVTIAQILRNRRHESIRLKTACIK